MTRLTTFGQRFDQSLRRWRVGGVRERTDLDFAEAMSITSGLVSQWKLREEPPPPGPGLKAARLLGVDPGWLYFDTASKAPAPDWWAAVLAELATQSPAPRARGHRAMTEEAERAATARPRRGKAS
jgi:hypothetical protein